MNEKDFKTIADILKAFKEAGIGFDDDCQIVIKTTLKTSDNDDLEKEKK